jgi:hypothetical protein
MVPRGESPSRSWGSLLRLAALRHGRVGEPERRERRQPRGDVDLDADERGFDAAERCRQDMSQHERHCSGAGRRASMPRIPYSTRQAAGIRCPWCRSGQIAASSATQAQPAPAQGGRSNLKEQPRARRAGRGNKGAALGQMAQKSLRTTGVRHEGTLHSALRIDHWHLLGAHSFHGSRQERSFHGSRSSGHFTHLQQTRRGLLTISPLPAYCRRALWPAAVRCATSHPSWKGGWLRDGRVERLLILLGGLAAWWSLVP